MKKLLVGLCAIFICTFAIAHSIEWYVDGSLYQTTTCNSGDNITPPVAPTKYGYSFAGWKEQYAKLEYIESTGTQYIDTGIILKSKATITSVGQFLSTSETAPESIWGFIGASTRPRWGWSIYRQNMWLADLNVTGQDLPPADTQKHTFVNTCYYVNTNLYYNGFVDGNAIYAPAPIATNVEEYTSNTLSAYLFARNYSNTAGNFSVSRIFSFNIVQDDVLVIDLIPARRNSDNAVGMYDTVSDTFFTNAGTGEFIAGPEVGDLR